jgi:very-short-patch-repair endonuclease
MPAWASAYHDTRRAGDSYGRQMPHQNIPARNRRFARAMRREPTDAEDKLWEEIRGRRLDGIKYRR